MIAERGLENDRQLEHGCREPSRRLESSAAPTVTAKDRENPMDDLLVEFINRCVNRCLRSFEWIEPEPALGSCGWRAGPRRRWRTTEMSRSAATSSFGARVGLAGNVVNPKSQLITVAGSAAAAATAMHADLVREQTQYAVERQRDDQWPTTSRRCRAEMPPLIEAGDKSIPQSLGQTRHRREQVAYPGGHQ